MADDLDWGPPYGFAIRRLGSCLPGECQTDAGIDPRTRKKSSRCCPSGANCNDDNTGLCCRDKNCTEEISNPAHCANATWSLFENYGGGYFCCEREEWGYNRSSGGVGCAPKGVAKADGTTPLAQISLGKTQFLVTRHKPSSDITTYRRDCNID